MKKYAEAASVEKMDPDAYARKLAALDAQAEKLGPRMVTQAVAARVEGRTAP